MSNLPPGVSVGDIPGNRPIDELWDAYLAEYDTAVAREEVVDALLDQFHWRGLEPESSDHSEARRYAEAFVRELGSIPMLALYAGLVDGDSPSFDAWCEQQAVQK